MPPKLRLDLDASMQHSLQQQPGSEQVRYAFINYTFLVDAVSVVFSLDASRPCSSTLPLCRSMLLPLKLVQVGL